MMQETAETAMPQSRPWTPEEVLGLFEMPFNDLLHRAQQVHRAHFDPNAVQISTLLSIKTGGCPEDCAYCPQSARYDTGLKNESLMRTEDVVAAARTARDHGAGRFCMGAAWRNPQGRSFERTLEMIRAVKALGLETCATFGMLTRDQAEALKDAGLDYYNHNLDTSRAYYERIISTRDYAERLTTLEHVRQAGMKVCCGGIIGMGETRRDRAEFLAELAALPSPPESVPINQLIRIPGTPLETEESVDPFEFVRTIAVARVLLPAAHVRLSAGRSEMSDELQALCFLAGANSIFYGEQLLTTGNPDTVHDRALFDRLGLYPEHEGGEDRARE